MKDLLDMTNAELAALLVTDGAIIMRPHSHAEKVLRAEREALQAEREYAPDAADSDGGNGVLSNI